MHRIEGAHQSILQNRVAKLNSPVKQQTILPLEQNIRKNFLWSKVKCLWAVVWQIHITINWKGQKSLIQQQTPISTPSWPNRFFCPNANISVTWQYKENQLKTWCTDRGTPIQQKKQLYSLKKEGREKLHLIFVHYVGTTFGDQVLHKYAAKLFSFVATCTDQKHFFCTIEIIFEQVH